MNWMSGTLSPEQMAAQMQQQQALTNALRQTGSFNPNGTPQQQQLAQGGQQGGDPSGGLAGGLGSLVGQGAGNVGTAMQYGTNPFSQQTNMLQAQNAGL